ncbi:MAG TPA: hypothetical protein VHX39_18180 [Acetobacteraceae bacterium]|nr:hypothetical protein [Acetobacteraceae bacterium]
MQWPRRRLLQTAAVLGSGGVCHAAVNGPLPFAVDPAKRDAWQARWQQHILTEAKARYCDTAMGEEIGWLISPLLNGFYYGFLLTGDTGWLDRLTNWTDAWIRRGVTEPDGHIGWPKIGAAGTDVDNLNSFYADSLLGEAMVLRPVVLTSAVMLKDPALAAHYGPKAHSYLELAHRTFEKWDQRGAWRTTDIGTISVVLPYGIDTKTGGWTDGERTKADLHVGFSHPDNKANQVGLWLLAMSDVTSIPLYRDRAKAWFQIMKSRLRLQPDGSYQVWNYWEPAGPWDYRFFGVPKHWIGVHPNDGYYATDVQAMVAAYEHGLVFSSDDLGHLIKTAQLDGRQWPAHAPYDATIRARFEQTLKPDGWAELSLVPWYLVEQRNGTVAR